MVTACSVLGLVIYQHVALIRYQLYPPNVSCKRLIS